MDQAIQRYIRQTLTATGLATRVGAYTVRFDPHLDSEPLNYAMPDDGITAKSDQLAELITAFTHRGLKPRLEYVSGCAPDLEAGLRTVGFTVDSRMPLMGCAASELVAASAVDGITIEPPSTMEDYRDAVTLQHRAFGEQRDPTEGEIATLLMDPVARGGVAAIARDPDGTVIGAGQYNPPHDGLAGVLGIAVAPASRGRGVGAGLTEWLTRTAHQSGVDLVWLDPSGENATRLYARLGYRVIGEMVQLSLNQPKYR